MDPLIEDPPLLLLLDLILLKARVYLHLLFNRNQPPKSGTQDSRDSVRASQHISNSLWSDWSSLALVTLIAESVARLVIHGQWHQLRDTDVAWSVLSVMVELFAQHVTTTCSALLVLKFKRWGSGNAAAQVTDGRQKHFHPIMISLTLLYSTILPLLLQLILGIWHKTEPTSNTSGSLVELSSIAHLVDRLPRSTQATILTIARDIADLWTRTDPVWAGTKLLGGMSAGFGLRVILPTRPIETTLIVLSGWAAADLANRLLQQISR